MSELTRVGQDDFSLTIAIGVLFHHDKDAGVHEFAHDRLIVTIRALAGVDNSAHYNVGDLFATAALYKRWQMTLR